MRKFPLANGQVYHVVNKSIAGYKIFPHQKDFQRMLRLMRYFVLINPPAKFTYFLYKSPVVQAKGFEPVVHDLLNEHGCQVQIIAYCLMPTHIHLVVRQVADKGISEFLRKVLNGYARYYNVKYSRQGSLWMGRFKNVLVETDEQLLHLTRYVHLNPVTAGLVKKAEDWPYSSYGEYVARGKAVYPLTEYTGLLDIRPDQYRAFVEDQVAYQRELAIIKEQASMD